MMTKDLSNDFQQLTDRILNASGCRMQQKDCGLNFIRTLSMRKILQIKLILVISQPMNNMTCGLIL